MSRVRGKDTKPELALRRALHAAGFRYRVNDRALPGTPDIAFASRRVAVFVDGCFWHGCPRHYTRPSSRQDFWDAKLVYNRDLRRRVIDRLQGWKVLEVWECDIRADLDAVVERIRAVLAASPAAGPRGPAESSA